MPEKLLNQFDEPLIGDDYDDDDYQEGFVSEDPNLLLDSRYPILDNDEDSKDNYEDDKKRISQGFKKM